MTKETRIGLLVGLLFIVAFGLVLSELTGTDAAPPAPAAMEENIESYAPTPVIEEVLHPAGPLASGPPAPAPPGEGIAAVEVSLGHRAAHADRGGVISAEISPGPAVLAATDEAPRPSPRPPSPAPAAVRPPRRRVYTVQPDDNLIRIARKVYGRDNEMLYKRIFEANRGVLVDESTVDIGQELVIPALPGGEERPGSASAPAPTPAAGGEGAPTGYAELDASALRRHFAGMRPFRRARRVYVVQRGDNLTDIARKLMNDDSPAAVRKIFNANRDTLESPHLLQVGMKLNIPS